MILETSEDYWKSDAGLLRRIDMISQVFTYKVVNNAYKIYGETAGVKWLVWYTKADERVCAQCGPLHMRRYRISWFQPRMPQHVNCRCQWGLEYSDREVETVKENLK
jgi:hypothetical protein